MTIEVAVFDTKPYDQEYLQRANKNNSLHLKFYAFHLNRDTAHVVHGAKAVCVFVNDTVDAECLDLLSEAGVKLIALRCAGFNNVDLKRAKELGIAVTRVPAYSPHAVAEHAVALALALNRKIYRSYNRVRELNFSLNGLIGFDICGKTIGIIGTGKIGRVVAQIFRGFNATILLFDKFPDEAWAQEIGAQYVDLDTVLQTSDIISLHVPLLPETYRLINDSAFTKMKNGAMLINTSRGKIVETSSMIAHLKSGHLGGVALDTYEEEEGIFFEDYSERILLDDELSRLLTFPNVLITAHQAFFTHEAMSEISRITIENLVCLQEKRAFIPETVL